MSPLGIELLEKLISHFEAGRPGGHEKFYFGEFHEGFPSEHNCGTLGCAAGELPVVFPDVWEFDGWGPCLIINSRNGVLNDLEQFFECSEDEINHLFFPDLQLPSRFGGKILTANCHASSWVKNAKEFVRRAKESK